MDYNITVNVRDMLGLFLAVQMYWFALCSAHRGLLGCKGDRDRGGISEG